ncbi:MAG: DUF2116 family Zn-ribbon domain-containing protein [Candidatus Thermoplasmatota archaeon]|nr:DUF2116 family Zn-ribbon domain-containing protein [Candidatus Thermoplasmatota archaeon]
MPGSDPKGPRKKRPIPRKAEPVPNDSPSAPAALHKHCNSCGLSIPPDAEYCSDNCRTNFERMVKRKKQLMWLPYIGIILMVLFYILVIRAGS